MPPGGVGRIRQHQYLCLVRQNGEQLLGAQTEFVVGGELNGHRNAGCQRHHGPITHKAGLWNQHLVPGIDQAADGAVNALTAAHGDENLLVIVIMQVKPAAEIIGDFPAHIGHTGIRSILCKALFQRVNAGVTDMPGGGKIRFANAQGNGVGHVLQNVEELPNARGLDVLYPLGDHRIVVDHTKISLSFCSSLGMNTTLLCLYFLRIKWVAVLVTPSMVESF